MVNHICCSDLKNEGREKEKKENIKVVPGRETGIVSKLYIC